MRGIVAVRGDCDHVPTRLSGLGPQDSCHPWQIGPDCAPVIGKAGGAKRFRNRGRALRDSGCGRASSRKGPGRGHGGPRLSRVAGLSTPGAHILDARPGTPGKWASGRTRAQDGSADVPIQGFPAAPAVLNGRNPAPPLWAQQTCRAAGPGVLRINGAALPVPLLARPARHHSPSAVPANRPGPHAVSPLDALIEKARRRRIRKVVA